MRATICNVVFKIWTSGGTMQSLLAAGILKHKMIPFKVNFYLWKSPWYTKCVSNFQCYFNAFQLSFFSWMFKWRHGRDQWVSLVDRAKPVSKSHNHTSILPLWYMAPTQSSSQLSLCKLQVAIFFSLQNTSSWERNYSCDKDSEPTCLWLSPSLPHSR